MPTPAIKVRKTNAAERKILRDSEAMVRFSAEALARANAEVGFLPGNQRHIQIQIKVRNQLARAAGYCRFDYSLIRASVETQKQDPSFGMVA